MVSPPRIDLRASLDARPASRLTGTSRPRQPTPGDVIAIVLSVNALGGVDHGMKKPHGIASSSPVAAARRSLKHARRLVKGLALGAGGAAALSVIEDAATGRATKDPRRTAARAAKAAVGTATHEAAVRAVAAGIERAAGKALLRTVAKSTANAAARGVLRSNVVTQAAALLVDQAVDTARLASGKINRKEYGRRTAGNVGGATGGLGGAAAGAAIVIERSTR